jgi:hypothetical protein
MSKEKLAQFAEDLAAVLPAVDAQTEGQYGNGLGSEDEETQLDLLIEKLREESTQYQDIQREIPYPESRQVCDLLLPGQVPVEAKLIRYWRANGDPEHYMPMRVFSPFHESTLLTDAQKLHDADFDRTGGLLGLFYKRSDDDPETVAALPERFTADELAERVAHDIAYWHGIDAEICAVESFSGLRHRIHKQGAVITWALE